MILQHLAGFNRFDNMFVDFKDFVKFKEFQIFYLILFDFKKNIKFNMILNN